MTQLWHSARARELIAASGGITEAAKHCRVAGSVLSTYQHDNKTAAMPADVITDLEAYCGRSIYSDAMNRRHTGAATSDDPLGEALELAEDAAHLALVIRYALMDGRIDATERRELGKIIAHIKVALTNVDDAVTGGPGT